MSNGNKLKQTQSHTNQQRTRASISWPVASETKSVKRISKLAMKPNVSYFSVEKSIRGFTMLLSYLLG